MTDDNKALLREAGMDVSAALERFMNNDAMLEKFLKKFRNDPSYNELLEAVDARDNDRAFKAAHTLKGVAANFSFETLRAAVSDQTECFRAGNLDDGIALMPRVADEYSKVADALTKIFGEE